MDDKEKHQIFLKMVEQVQAAKPLRPESEKFTFYDVRGLHIYSLLSNINMQIVQLHDEVMKNVFTDIIPLMKNLCVAL